MLYYGIRLMDEIDLRIMSILGHDGRVPNTEIARRSGVSEGTVRQRLKKLFRTRALKVQALVNTEGMSGQYVAVIGLSIESKQLEKCAERIDRMPGVQQTLIVTGRYDILVSLLLDSHDRLVDFVTHKLSTLPGIRDSETFVCLKNYNPWFPVECVEGVARDVNGRTSRRDDRRRRRE